MGFVRLGKGLSLPEACLLWDSDTSLGAHAIQSMLHPQCDSDMTKSANETKSKDI